MSYASVNFTYSSDKISNKLLRLLLLIFCISACSDNKVEKRSALKSLGDTAGNFAKPSRNNVIKFPDAHGPKKSFQQEWWYLTANLTTENGDTLATQWTLFRRSVEDKHWYFAHAALADAIEHQSAFRSAREELGHLAISTEPFNAVIDDWQWQSSKALLPANLRYGEFIDLAIADSEPLNSSLAKPSQERRSRWQVNLDLSLDIYDENTPTYFLQGEQGFSQKHHTLDIASHYYSQPFIHVSGEVYWHNKWQKVTGKAWFDREWGSQMLAEDQQGWDWFSLRLNAQTALMVYRIRSNKKDYLYGSVMHKDGSIKTLSNTEIVLQNNSVIVANEQYPDAFNIKIAQQGIDINVKVINKNQIMRFGIEYFEGMVSFNGSHQGQGFLEMTGYK